MREGASIGLRAFLIAAACLVGIAVLVAGVWAFRVVVAEPKGRGDAVIQREGANNRIAAQARFEELYAEVRSADERITVAAQAVKDDPSVQNRTNLTGLTNHCIDTRADYDAEARKYLAEQFRAADLPPQIDKLDPATDCKGDRP